MLQQTENGVVHTGRTVPHTTAVPKRREVAAALLKVAERMRKAGCTSVTDTENLDVLWRYFATH